VFIGKKIIPSKSFDTDKDSDEHNFITVSKNNRQIIAQKGAFIYFNKKVEIKSDHIIKISNKKKILSELGRMGINKSTVIPSMVNIIKEFRNKLILSSGIEKITESLE